MITSQIVIKYLLQLINICDAYPVGNIPGAIKAGGHFIKLHEVYSHLSVISLFDYEMSLNLLPGEKYSPKYVIETEPSDEMSTPSILLFLSNLGGGKSTRLKMYGIAYAYQYLKSIGYDFCSEEFRINVLNQYYEDDGDSTKIDRWINEVEELCKTMHVYNDAFPVFVDLKSFGDLNSFDGVIAQSIINPLIGSDLFERYLSEVDISLMLKTQKRIVVIVDSLEVCCVQDYSNSFDDMLLKYLSNNNNIYRVLLGARYSEYQNYQHLHNKQLLSIDERLSQYFIADLPRKFKAIKSFAQKWYQALRRINESEIDNEWDNLKYLRRYSSSLEVLRNPLSLTGIIMISISENFPVDRSMLYGKSLELCIIWNNHNNYNCRDVLIQLAYIAYHMSISEVDRDGVDDRELSELIYNSRIDLRDYYRQNWGIEELEVNQFYAFLIESRIFVHSRGKNEFSLKGYQSYLTAYCISNELFTRDKRIANRYKYLDEHIRNCEEFWDDIIQSAYLLDTDFGDLRDDIVNALLDAATSARANIYTLLIILNIKIGPSSNFSYNELKSLYFAIVNGYRYLSSISKIFNYFIFILEANSKKENDAFIDIVLETYNSIDLTDRNRFVGYISSLVYLCIWNYEVSETYMRTLAEIFLKDHFTNFSVYATYRRKDGGFHDRALYHVLEELDAEMSNKNDGSFNQYKFYLANIEGYSKEGLWPCDVAFSLMESNEEKDKITALHIFHIASLLRKSNLYDKYHYDFAGATVEMLRKLSSFLNFYIYNPSSYSNIAKIAYLQFYASPMPNGWIDSILDEKVFIQCFKRGFQNWSPEYKYDGEFDYDLTYIATYPLFIADKYLNRNNLATIDDMLSKRDSFINHIHKVIDNRIEYGIETYIVGLKLLSLFEDRTFMSDIDNVLKNDKARLQKEHLDIFAERVSAYFSLSPKKESLLRQIIIDPEITKAWQH